MADATERNPVDANDPCRLCTKQLLTIPEACQYLGMSTSKGYNLKDAGQFPVSIRRVGSKLCVAKAELDEWLRTPQPPGSSGPSGLRAV